MTRPPSRSRWFRPWLAAAVHVFTASGALLAFLATLAVIDQDVRAAFLWLFLAGCVDALDGWLARVVRVAEQLPQISGSRLDDLVDYLTFVFVPALLMWRADVLPADWGAVVVAAILLSSAFGFAHENAKTADHFFRGFPSYWNIVALYLFVTGLPPSINGAIVCALAASVFVPVGFVYPSRTSALRTLTLVLAAVWGVLVLAIVLQLPDPAPRLVWLSLGFPAYYTAVSLALHARGRAG